MAHIIAALATSAFGSSHREAPAIALDPSADITDFYAFRSLDDPDKVVLIMNVNPLENPGGGPNFHRFDDNVRYKIHVDNEGDGTADKVFVFQFTTTYDLPGEFLYNVGSIGDPANINIKQTYEAWVMEDGVRRDLVTAADPGMVAPINVGVVSDGGYTPYGTDLSTLTDSYVKTVGDTKFFAGPRQEGFFVDLERTFDLLNLANVDNSNTLLGYNVHTIALEIPASELTRDGMAPSAANQNEVIALWSTTHRQRIRRLLSDGTSGSSGDWVQVARLGSPLVNEVVIPIAQKDLFNASKPRDDAQFLTYVTDPILPIYMEAVLGVPNPLSFDAGLGIGGREDLVLAFLTGHPALGTMPSGYALGGPIPGEAGKFFGAFEALRLNLTTPSGFPNGRLVGDDVVDVALSAMAGLLIDGTFIPDGVDSTGLNFLSTFPYLGDPWFGDDHPQNFHSSL
ncbi:MAG: DUF4331 domain-containing protein [Myxococcota bacterium]